MTRFAARLALVEIPAGRIPVGTMVTVGPDWIGKVEWQRAGYTGIREVRDGRVTRRVDEVQACYTVGLSHADAEVARTVRM